MANSLLTGFSGLTAHQKMIEVVGNNLANLNTIGFKASRASFSDVFYETVKSGSGGEPGVIGGSNPAQIGNGTKLSSVAVNFSQGGLEATGSQLDFAINGEGFFVVNGQDGAHYTRAGVFTLDKNSTLVDAATGYQVQRFGTVGEATSQNPGFQTPGSTSIRLPLGASVPGQATSVVNLRGNLHPSTSPATTQSLSTVAPWTVGGAAASAGDLVNNLDFVSSPYATGDSIQVTGRDHNGATISTLISVNATTTLQNLLDSINTQFTGATARIEADGTLVMDADQARVSFLDMTLSDAAGNAGSANFAANALQLAVSGTDGDVVRGGMEIYDEQGRVHIVGVEMRKQADGTWDLDASLAPSEGTALDARIEGITLNPDGTFQTAGVAGVGDANLVFQFSATGAPQVVQVNFGAPGTFASLTSIAVESSLVVEQDGYSTGTLVGFQIDEAGTVVGTGSNGRRFDIAQVALALFRNPHGLENEGNNLFRTTSSSGPVELGTARTAGRGSILAGQLEQSNVDIGAEFTRLIIAQRGFSANARTITVTDEILQELTSLIR